MEDMLELDKNLAETLIQLKDLGNQKEEIEKNTSINAQQQVAMIKKLSFKVSFYTCSSSSLFYNIC